MGCGKIKELEWKVWYEEPNDREKVEILYVADNRRFLAVYKKGEFMAPGKKNNTIFAKPFLWRRRT